MWESSDPKLESQPSLAVGTPVRLTCAAPALWRVMDASGRVIGHLQASAQRQGVRYRARRFHTASRTFNALGISPALWNVSATRCCEAMTSGVSGSTP